MKMYVSKKIFWKKRDYTTIFQYVTWCLLASYYTVRPGYIRIQKQGNRLLLLLIVVVGWKLTISDLETDDSSDFEGQRACYQRHPLSPERRREKLSSSKDFLTLEFKMSIFRDAKTTHKTVKVILL